MDLHFDFVKLKSIRVHRNLETLSLIADSLPFYDPLNEKVPEVPPYVLRHFTETGASTAELHGKVWHKAFDPFLGNYSYRQEQGSIVGMYLAAYFGMLQSFRETKNRLSREQFTPLFALEEDGIGKRAYHIPGTDFYLDFQDRVDIPGNRGGVVTCNVIILRKIRAPTTPQRKVVDQFDPICTIATIRYGPFTDYKHL